MKLNGSSWVDDKRNITTRAIILNHPFKTQSHCPKYIQMVFTFLYFISPVRFTKWISNMLTKTGWILVKLQFINKCTMNKCCFLYYFNLGVGWWGQSNSLYVIGILHSVSESWFEHVAFLRNLRLNPLTHPQMTPVRHSSNQRRCPWL